MKDNTVTNLDNKQIFTAVKTIVEVITLEYMENPEGFKLFFDADSLEPLYGYYFHEQLHPHKYTQSVLSPNELEIVLKWRNNK